jgi:hypothetical protein
MEAKEWKIVLEVQELEERIAPSTQGGGGQPGGNPGKGDG